MRQLSVASRLAGSARTRRKIFIPTLTAFLLGPLLYLYPSIAIQGGESAKGTTFVMALVIRIDESRAELCSAGLLAPRVIVTAAHCVVQGGVKVKPESILVFPPGGEVSTPTKSEVVAIFTPVNYKNNSLIAEPDDIAFLVLDSPIEGLIIEAIADSITAKKIIDSKVPIILYGYGITGRQQPPSGFPKSLVLRQIEQVSLDGFSGKEHTYISYAQEASGAACNGDSGGPAIANFNGLRTLVSVHSASAGACSAASTIDSNWGTIPGEYKELYNQALALASVSQPTPSPSQKVEATPIPSPSSTIQAPSYPSTKKPITRKKTTITCVKGKVVRKVTAYKPKCPAGFVKKK